jgi:tRNA(Ile)-lysidine synthase
LRGRSSNADERLVVRTAKQFGLPVIVERAEVKALVRSEKVSMEMAARQVRHEFLARTARRLKIPTIALAHHADDQVELFFLRLLRGSGGEGLAGMKWRNPSPADARLELVRPLLDQSKAALRTFAEENKIPFREDASNESLDILRNRIRHELLPLLRRDYQPALDRTIARVMEIVGAEAEAVGELATQWLGGGDTPAQASVFDQLPLAVQRRCLQSQLLEHHVTPSFDLVETLRTRPGHRVKVSPELAVSQAGDGHLREQGSRLVVPSNPAVCELALTQASRRAAFSGVNFVWRRVVARRRSWAQPQPGRETFDADKVGSPITLRHWRAGDRFQPSGMKSLVKLQDLFVNAKIPRDERQTLVVATTAGGEIFWVERLRIAERFKWTGATKHCLQWQWKRF